MSRQFKSSISPSFNEMSQEEFIELMNNELPIDISLLEELIERIYNRYPLIDKYEIILIVKGTFQAMRELIIMGKVLTFTNFIFDVKLCIVNFFKSKRKSYPKISIRTSPKIRGKANG